MILECNNFSIVINVTELTPKAGSFTHEAKVTKIVDQLAHEGVSLTADNTCTSLGDSERLAVDKCEDRAREWANKQR